MTATTPYLAFDGNCREVMEFYKSCLGGELNMHSFETMPDAENISKKAHKGIMHANLTKGVLAIMASGGGGMKSLTKGNTVSLSLNYSSDEEITKFFQKLFEGGTVTMSLTDHFWGSKVWYFHR